MMISSDKEVKKDYSNPLEEIDALRHEIDRCDEALIQIFQQRMRLVMEILENKRKNNLPIFQAQREQEVIQNALKTLKEKDYADAVEDFLIQIMKISRKLQSRKLFPYNIVLIGFMGTGKTTVGKDLSQKLSMDYIDTDALIQERMGISINEIFEKYGEDFFRKIEKNIIDEISATKNTIILCGGGVVLNQENIPKLRENGKTILLKAQPITIYHRVKEDHSRPLLKGRMSLETIEKLLKEREEAYTTSADLTIETDGKMVEEITSEIITKLNALAKEENPCPKS